jgi:hypothetical protein
MVRLLAGMMIFWGGGWIASCAATNAEGTTSVEMDVENTNVPLTMRMEKPQPIYSTSLAINMAELAVRNAGKKVEDRNVKVSFCDGVYSVVFEKHSKDMMDCDYLVDIDAGTSRVLKIVTSK